MPSKKKNAKIRGNARKAVNLSFPTPYPKPVSVVGMEKHLPGVSSLCNPWAEESIGAKIPDDDATKSVPVTVRQVHGIEVGANGTCLVNFGAQPFATSGYKNESSTSGGVVDGTVAPINNADGTAWQTQFDRYRIVSWGVRIYNIDPITTAKGQLKLMTLEDGTYTVLVAGRSFAGSLYSEVETFPVSQSDVYWISTPVGTGWKEYIGMTYTAPWTQLAVYVSDAAAGAKFTAELIYNCECVVDLNSISSRLVTPAADHNPVVLAASSKVRATNNIHSSRPSMFKVLGDMAKSALFDVASVMLPHAAGALSGLLGGRRAPKLKQIAM